MPPEKIDAEEAIELTTDLYTNMQVGDQTFASIVGDTAMNQIAAMFLVVQDAIISDCTCEGCARLREISEEIQNEFS